MKWHKRKKSLHTIPHNGIAIGTPICWYVVNVLLLKLRPELYQSRYNPSPFKVKQHMIHTAIQSRELLLLGAM